ncbi:MAG: PorT family protein [Fibromonadaceae bacterium]|jgi:hypothetical protein|nr:PorT family protein [Fibromonadaceae bacterium]
MIKVKRPFIFFLLCSFACVFAQDDPSSLEVALKECDFVFNPERRFCYDGEVYEKCDGMEYNPSTHICTGVIARRALCDGTQYNPLTHRCGDNVVEELTQETVPAAIAEATPAVATPPAVAEKQCESKLNINELIFKVQVGFPKQLKDCSSKLAKNMALQASPFFKGKKDDPKTFMMQCPMDGIKEQLPASAVEYVKSVESFIQGVLGAVNDPKAILSAVDGMNVNDLLVNIKNMVANDPCVVDEPFEPPVVVGGGEDDGERGKKENRSVWFGLRGGGNLSHLYADYNDSYRSASGSYEAAGGWQLGLVLDVALNDWFYLQPGVMFIRKGASRDNDRVNAHYLEFPLLASLKFSAFRINAGPYYGICLGSSSEKKLFDNDFGLSTGLGFDIGMFYIGTFYDYGLIDMSKRNDLRLYNRTLGFNFGVNL